MTIILAEILQIEVLISQTIIDLTFQEYDYAIIFSHMCQLKM